MTYERTIDITPLGVQTPEGAERVRKAQETWGDAQADLANRAASFFQEYGADIRNAVQQRRLPTTILDDLDEIDEAARRMKTAQDAFLRAVAGAPEAKPLA